jgi:hypothetical protein
MKRSNWQLILILMASALLPVMASSANDPVARPFKMNAHSQMVVNLIDGSFDATAWGQATHCGQTISLGWGMLNPLTGEGFGEGKIIAANGDKILYDNPTMADSIITGGTGRFEGAVGGFTVTLLSRTASIDPVAGTMTLYFVWTASGSITY